MSNAVCCHQEHILLLGVVVAGCDVRPQRTSPLARVLLLVSFHFRFTFFFFLLFFAFLLPTFIVELYSCRFYFILFYYFYFFFARGSWSLLLLLPLLLLASLLLRAELVEFCMRLALIPFMMRGRGGGKSGHPLVGSSIRESVLQINK